MSFDAARVWVVLLPRVTADNQQAHERTLLEQANAHSSYIEFHQKVLFFIALPFSSTLPHAFHGLHFLFLLAIFFAFIILIFRLVFCVGIVLLEKEKHILQNHTRRHLKMSNAPDRFVCPFFCVLSFCSFAGRVYRQQRA